MEMHICKGRGIRPARKKPDVSKIYVPFRVGGRNGFTKETKWTHLFVSLCDVSKLASKAGAPVL